MGYEQVTINEVWERYIAKIIIDRDNAQFIIIEGFGPLVQDGVTNAAGQSHHVLKQSTQYVFSFANAIENGITATDLLAEDDKLRLWAENLIASTKPKNLASAKLPYKPLPEPEPEK